MVLVDLVLIVKIKRQLRINNMVLHLVFITINGILGIIPFLFQIVGEIFNFSVVVEKLPLGIDAVLVQGVGYIRFLIGVFPPFGPLYAALLWVIGFKVLLKIVAMIPVVRGLLHK